MKISKESCNKIFTVHIIIIKGSHLEFQEMKKNSLKYFCYN